jgi:adenylosuccinate lyase
MLLYGLELALWVAEQRRALHRLREALEQIAVGAISGAVGTHATNFQAYKKAQAALQVNEDMTFSDQEIDAFLPKELKRGQLA